MVRARTLVYKLMMAAPVFLLVAIAASARVSEGEFQFVKLPAQTQKEIMEYVPVVRSTESLQREQGFNPPIALSRAEVAKWLKGYDEGRLRALEPAFYGDSTRDSVKSDALKASIYVAGALLRAAETEVDFGVTRQGIEDALSAARCAEILKYSDFYSITVCAAVQRRAIMAIHRGLPRVTPAERTKYINRALCFKVKRSTLDQMAKIARRQFTQFLSEREAGVSSNRIARRIVDIDASYGKEDLVPVAITAEMGSVSTEFSEARQLASDVVVGVHAANTIQHRLTQLTTVN